MNIVRQSKFRHVFCKPVKHEQCMSEVRITEITWDSLFCDVNPKFIALIIKGSGGPFMVVPLKKVGRIDKDYPLVDAHRAPCLEVQFSPFNDHVIASCSEDTTAKVWLIPERGLIRTLTEPVIELVGHEKRVNTLQWHPTANNILVTAGGENKLLIWNVGTGEALLEVDGHPDQIWSISFNYDGSRFVTTCKDRKIRIIDSHSGEIVSEGLGHEGVKPQRAVFLKDNRILTTGFTKRSERLFALRDSQNISEPLVQEDLDTSNGVLFPLVDEDSGLMYLVGKGDCAIRYYEINNEYPFIHYINTYTTTEPQRGIAFMPKRGLNSNDNEISRIYKVTTKGVVDILQFFVPRKSDLWQSDLYPDTRSTVPAITAEEFASGKNAPPNLMAVNPGAAEAKPKLQVAKKANILAQLPPSAEECATVQSEPKHQEFHQPQTQILRNDDSATEKFDKNKSKQHKTRSEPVEAPNPMIVKQQVTLKPREERDAGSLTAGQQRAAKELNKIRREQTRGAEFEEPSTTTNSKQINIQSCETGDLDDDIKKIKQLLRQHERRIRLLEDQLADVTMANAYGI